MTKEQRKQPAMPDSVRKDLEEMAIKHAKAQPYACSSDDDPCVLEGAKDFLAGAQAAWALAEQAKRYEIAMREAEIAELESRLGWPQPRTEWISSKLMHERIAEAVKAERERCAEIAKSYADMEVGDEGCMTITTVYDIKCNILNPTKE